MLLAMPKVMKNCAYRAELSTRSVQVVPVLENMVA